MNTMARTSEKSPKVAKKAAANRVVAKPALLSGSNPRIAKADGDAPVQAYIVRLQRIDLTEQIFPRTFETLFARSAKNLRS